jgi:hypothetical protein
MTGPSRHEEEDEQSPSSLASLLHNAEFNASPEVKEREAIPCSKAIAIEPFVSRQIRKILRLAPTRAF